MDFSVTTFLISVPWSHWGLFGRLPWAVSLWEPELVGLLVAFEPALLVCLDVILCWNRSCGPPAQEGLGLCMVPGSLVSLGLCQLGLCVLASWKMLLGSTLWLCSSRSVCYSSAFLLDQRDKSQNSLGWGDPVPTPLGKELPTAGFGVWAAAPRTKLSFFFQAMKNCCGLSWNSVVFESWHGRRKIVFILLFRNVNA